MFAEEFAEEIFAEEFAEEIFAEEFAEEIFAEEIFAEEWTMAEASSATTGLASLC